MIKPRIVNQVTDAGLVIKDNDKKVNRIRVCSKETSDKIKEITAAVFTEGSARGVRSNVVSMGGKTGTAQIATKGAYQKSKKYNASFVGHFPADKPVYSIYVRVTEPSNGKFYASSVAAPVFSEIAKKIFTISVKQEIDNEHVESPLYTRGYYSDFKQLNNVLNVKLKNEVNTDIVSINAVAGSASGVVVRDGKMPNVKGMGAKDAIYLLELNGLQPRINGYGRVMEQSPEPGTRVQANRTVYIRLN
jgi:cell division protein FtsI (penicillin-binding protein 3)